MYGASGSWYYSEPSTDPLATLILSLFTTFNQAWFMGLFFLLSGYFSPVSYDHKGPWRFMKDRLIRLGIPMLAFYFILSPITIFLATFSMTPAELAQQGYTSYVTFSWGSYLSSTGVGPLWFVEMLLLFDLIYILWRVIQSGSGDHSSTERDFPTYGKIAAFIAVLALSAYLLRIVIPINAQVLGFPSLFDLPQYAGLFMVGLAASRGNWLVKMPDRMGKGMFKIAIAASATFLPLALIGTVDSSLGWGTVYGYGSLSSAFYSIWDSIFAVGASMFAVGYFRRRFNTRGKYWEYTSQHFYTVYVIQTVVIVGIGTVLLQPLHLESLLKFSLAALIIVPLTWLLAYPVRRIPFADRVL